jgi:hypothetical protein
VFVQPPIIFNYVPAVQYWIKTKDSQFSTDIQTKVQSAYRDYIAWQRSKIGRDVNPSVCDRKLIEAGAKRTDIPGSTTFLFSVLDAKTLAIETDVNLLAYAGLEDE